MDNVVRTCKVEENMIINVDKSKISDFMPLLSNFNIELHELNEDTIEIQIKNKQKLRLKNQIL